MQPSSLWYLGYDLKRTYLRNLLLSMAIVYGTVFVLAGLYLTLQRKSPSMVTLDVLGAGNGYGNSGPVLTQTAPGRERESGSPLSSTEPDQIPTGFFSLGQRIHIIRENFGSIPVTSSYRGVSAAIPGPDDAFGSGPDEGDGTLDGLVESGDLDYGLPPGPTTIARYSPQFFASAGSGPRRLKKNRPLRIHLAGLQWPKGVPANVVCNANLEVTFNADGTHKWKVLEVSTDSGYSACLPAFELELRRALLRTWFEPQIQNGIRRTQVVDLHATFCPTCEPKAWAEKGDLEVYLKK